MIPIVKIISIVLPTTSVRIVPTVAAPIERRGAAVDQQLDMPNRDITDTEQVLEVRPVIDGERAAEPATDE
jgi:hypothetical protein